MAASPVKIGVACPIAGERAAFMEWLRLAGYEPVSVTNVDIAAREMSTRPLEALIADVALIAAPDLPRIVKMLGPNRPLMLVGNRKDAIEATPRDAAWIERPVTRSAFQLSVALALAEGRPARRSPRKLVPRLNASVDGVASKLVDVSTEGVRLEIPGAATGTLPPYFILKVPSFGVAAKIKRVWVTTPAPHHVWCGGIVEQRMLKNEATPWDMFVQKAPVGSRIVYGNGPKILQVD
jgi:hypothetical protein